jgi:sulfur carrier protein ThiS
MLTVPVRLNGTLAAALGPRITLELHHGATVRDLLAAVGARADVDLPPLAVSAGGRLVGLDDGLADGVELAVLMPVSGG